MQKVPPTPQQYEFQKYDIKGEKPSAAGFSDPKKTRKRQTVNVKALIFFIFMILALCVVFFMLTRSPKPEIVEHETVHRVGDEEYLELINRLKEKDRRLDALEADKANWDALLEEKLKNALAGYTAPQQDLTPLWDNLNQIQARLDDLHTAPQEETPPAPEYPETPPQGSGAVSTLYNDLGGMVARREQAQQDRLALLSLPPKFAPADGALAGDVIHGTLVTGLISSPYLDQMRAVVVTTVDQTLDGVLIPKGTRFIGNPVQDVNGTRRIYLPLDEMVLNGKSMRVRALATYKGNAGLVTNYIDPKMQAAWSSFLPNLVASGANFLQTTVTKSTWRGEQYEEPARTPKNAALAGVAGSLAQVGNAMQSSAENKQPVVVVHAGLPIQIILQERISAGDLASF